MPGMTHMIPVSSAAALFVAITTAVPQPIPFADPWSHLAALGSRPVRIAVRTGKQLRGAIIQVSDDVLVLNERGNWRDVAREDVCDIVVNPPAIRTDPDPSMSMGALAGVFLGAKLCQGDCLTAVIGGSLLGAIGGGIMHMVHDASRTRHRWVSVYHNRSAC